MGEFVIGGITIKAEVILIAAIPAMCRADLVDTSTKSLVTPTNSKFKNWQACKDRAGERRDWGGRPFSFPVLGDQQSKHSRLVSAVFQLALRFLLNFRQMDSSCGWCIIVSTIQLATQLEVFINTLTQYKLSPSAPRGVLALLPN